MQESPVALRRKLGRNMPDADGPCPYESCDGSGFLIDVEENAARECRCRGQRIAARRTRSLLRELPPRFQDLAWERPPINDLADDQIREAKRYANNITANIEQGHGIAFVGDVGTAKSALAYMIVKTALAHGHTAYHTTFGDLLNRIKATYDRDSGERSLDLLEQLKAVDLLHIDDLGRERPTDHALEQLFIIVNGRYEQRKAIVYTSNLTPDVLAKRVGAAITSRLLELAPTIVPMYGLDQRKDGTWDVGTDADDGTRRARQFVNSLMASVKDLGQ